MKKDFKAILLAKTSEVERIVYNYLPTEKGLQATVIDAMSYSVEAGGKRLRPLLMLETFKMFEGKGKAIEYFMAAIEMIHNYSLVHDDLPAMDNDMLRRGKPTTHAVYGEAMAILAGDGLLTYAFEVASKAFAIETEDYQKIGKAIQILSNKAGIYGMVGGQVVDIESEEKGLDITKAQINFIHENKTAALIEAAMTIGAVLAGADASQIQLIEKVASNIGVAFQIQDDILDVEGDEAILGKPIGSDQRNEKSTYVTFVGLEKSKEEVKRLTDQAIDSLNSLAFCNEFLVDLMNYLVYRDN